MGVTPALASYHLRQLGRYGFVVEDPELARDGRERWWRAAQARTSWDSAAFLDTPDRIAALSSLHREQFLAYQARSTSTSTTSPRSTPTGSPRPTTATTSSSSTPTACAR